MNNAWLCRQRGEWPNASVEIVDNHVEIKFSEGPGHIGDRPRVDKRTARLLAKRILQALEETK